jgi:putative MATE family efflux protein
VSGSILRHILVMTGAGALGLMAIFAGDLANMWFLSRLGDEAVIAAIGYASSILFFTISIGIGLSIAATSLVSPAIGAGHKVRARRLSVNVHLATGIAARARGGGGWRGAPGRLRRLGATGRALELADRYLDILVPSLPLLAVAMTSAAVLRSVGDARRAMNVTLVIAIVTVILDPILIFGAGLGIDGAAIASTVARLAAFAVGLHGVIVVHGLMGRPKLRPFLGDVRAMLAIAAPAILTNIATPAANAYVTAAIAPSGDAAVGAWAIIGRIMPVAFGAIYALSGTIGPIIGQNHGARSYDRVEDAIRQSLLVTAVFTLAAWILLALFAEPLASTFRATGDAAALVILFCRWLAPLFVFMGALFIANAAFNTLGYPHYSTVLNWLRATLGTVPFVEAGARIAGAKGVLTGNMLGGVVFGVAAVVLAFRLVRRIAAERASDPPSRSPGASRPPR